ncbi:T9SS C-terminal target domain-containing protein [bacterium]|nr:MAG: T9SS C-terminal target domain-containing protein [bacterium]
MKHLSTILFVLVALMCVAATGYGQLLLQETFKDTTSNIGTLPNWSELSAGTIGSTVAPPYIVVKPNSALFYAGYIESGNGNSAYLSGGGQDAQVVVRDVTSGVVYLAFLIKVDSATAAGDYIWIVRNTSNHNRWRMWIKRDTSTASTTSFNFGISKGTTGMQYTASKYSFGTTYLVIAKYDFNTTATTDAKMNLWVNPPIGGASDDLNPVIKDYTDPGTDFVSINRLALVQNAVATAPTFSIGGIRMGGKWLEVLPPPPLYYNGTGAINDPNSWGKNSDGSGARPSDFASDNQLYVVRNTTAVSLTAQWIVSGVGSKVIIGSSVNLTVASGGLLAAPAVDVNSGGTLTLTQSSFWPAFGDIAGTVSFNNAAGFSLDADYTFPASSGYYDLKSVDINLSGKTLTVKGRLRCNGYKVLGIGTFKLDSAGTLFISSPNGITASGATGDIQAATRQFSRYANYVYAGTANQVTGDAIPDTVVNLTIQMANRNLTTSLSKLTAASGNLTMTLGKFKLGALNLWFNNPSGQSDSSYVITDGTGSLVRPISTTSKKTMPVGSATEYRVAALTFSKTPTAATNISFRYVPGDPGSAGLPTGATNYYRGGSWMITSDVTPGATFRLDLNASGVGLDSTALRVLVRPNSSTAWQYAGIAAGFTGGMVADTVISNFGQFAIAVGPKVSAVEESSSLPKEIALMRNYPNPFNPATTIRFELPSEMRVSLTVFNLLGQQITKLVDETRPAGSHAITFDASQLTSGVYLYQLQSGSFNQTRKMLLVK